ncbi:hypothetical protein HDU76_010843, partial [Blyttiomyces sp. JEL0837]
FDYLWVTEATIFGVASTLNRCIADASVNSKAAMLFLLEFHDFNTYDRITVSLDAAAICNGNVEVVEFLLQPGAVALKDSFLNMALQYPQIRVAEVLYESGCRISIPDGFDIDEAALVGDIDVVKFVQKHFPTAMDLAAQECDLEMVEFLNKNRSEVCVESAMVAAAKNADSDMVVYLFENRKADCNVDSVLVEAMKSGSLRLVRYLLSNGVGLSSEDIKAEVEEELAGFVNEPMAQLVRKHLSLLIEMISWL